MQRKTHKKQTQTYNISEHQIHKTFSLLVKNSSLCTCFLFQKTHIFVLVTFSNPTMKHPHLFWLSYWAQSDKHGIYRAVYECNSLTHVSFTCQTSSKASETGTNDDSIMKDDDDDNDDDDDDKVPPGSNIDPERLKSFNVRGTKTYHIVFLFNVHCLIMSTKRMMMCHDFMICTYAFLYNF
mgnify:CR=1 FL=1